MPITRERSKKAREAAAAETGQTHAQRDPDALLTVQEAGTYLRFSDRKVLNMVRDGSLAAHRLGNDFRIRWGDVQALLESSRT